MAMDKQENQGDQSKRKGRVRCSRTKTISDVRGLFADLTDTQTMNRVAADPQVAGNTSPLRKWLARLHSFFARLEVKL